MRVMRDRKIWFEYKWTATMFSTFREHLRIFKEKMRWVLCETTVISETLDMKGKASQLHGCDTMSEVNA